MPFSSVRPPESLTRIVSSRCIPASTDGSPFGPSSWPDYRTLASTTRVFAALAAADDRTRGTVNVGGYSRMTRITAVSGDFFATLGIAPHLGRMITAEDVNGSRPSAVISLELWEAAGSPQLGAVKLTASGRDYEVIGVAPRRFRGLQAGRLSDVWIPISGSDAGDRGDRRLALIARMRAGTDSSEIEDALQSVSERLATEFPATNRGTQTQPDKARRHSGLLVPRRSSPRLGHKLPSSLE